MNSLKEQAVFCGKKVTLTQIKNANLKRILTNSINGFGYICQDYGEKTD